MTNTLDLLQHINSSQKEIREKDLFKGKIVSLKFHSGGSSDAGGVGG